MLVPFLFANALAGPVFTAKDAEISLGGGTWGRLHPSDTGWWWFEALAGESWVIALGDDLSGYIPDMRQNLTNHGSLQDVQEERCSDGTWLLAGSYSATSYDDSIHAWRYDADFNLLAEVVIEEETRVHQHNDMIVLCDDVVTGVAFSNPRGDTGSVFYAIDGTTLGASTELDFEAMGASMAVRASDGRIVAADVYGPQADHFRMSVYDPDWTLLSRVEVPIPEGYAFWPQRLLAVEDGWVLTYLVRPEETDVGDGVVWLVAMDADFNVLDNLQITDVPSARPWVARKGDVLAVSYDRDVVPRVTLVHLDTSGFPEPVVPGDTGVADDTGDTASDTASGPGETGSEDTAVVDTASVEDSGREDTPTPERTHPCGCAVATWVWLPLGAWSRRRRR